VLKTPYWVDQIESRVSRLVSSPILSSFLNPSQSSSTEKAFAECSLLLDDNRLLFAQNNEKVSRKSARSTVVGTAKVMSYEDIVEAQTNRDAKAAGRISKRKKSAPVRGLERRRLKGLWNCLYHESFKSDV
jgi:hypothetical protein